MYRSIEVYKRIRDEISWGELNPGERLIETDLCNKYGLSRGPVRVALTYLKKDGYVNIMPNRGAVVAKVSADEVREYFELLSFLEGKSVELAFPNLSKTDLKKLTRINKSISVSTKKMIQRNEIVRLRDGNLNFHCFIGSKCGNSKLPVLVKYVRKRLFRFSFWLTAAKKYFEDNFNDHVEIISHLERQDCTAARLSMEKHIMRTCKLYLNTLPQF